MGHAETVQHFFAHLHAECAGAVADRYEFHAHPLAEWVVVEHAVEYLEGGHEGWWQGWWQIWGRVG